MNKVLLIIQREYLTRVRKKSFIIMIFVVPLLILAMGFVVAMVAKDSDKLSSLQTVNVIDKSGDFANKFHDVTNVKFTYALTDLKSSKQLLKDSEGISILYIPANYTQKDSVQIFSKKKASIPLSEEIEKQMSDIAFSNNLIRHHIDTALLRSIKRTNISLNAIEISDKGDKNANIGPNILIGIACAILIYISLFIYGGQVMRGVIEEKTNRIIEVVISSVKPFQLMLGKIIGVGLVGLTQFGAWIILSVISTKIAGHALNSPTSPVINALAVLQTIPFGYIMGCFIFYFLSGYLLYAALFAAVGSAVDSETETQQFMFPITMPLLFTYILSVSVLFRAPDSPLAVWLSMIPFTAPVAMMVRIPFDPPGWQVALSMSLMVIGFLCTTYVAARIYRVGVLMYGKKASYKELAKWFFYKE
ncbi:ABC transporter permease [Mucilaginibacter gossypii]|uniref:ABC transporter permease n=1 Tax=Mucilaginibacter gossypii TaxID=551996 RepID=UPI000DCD63AA|nr:MULTISPECIES: ABC transporter permease [Mucilaginibacter]QTE37818.1 ABC transporter permease [Mucilaginibacter gossypii]RAV60537.1 ABC transporter permease [Mucilaginibacter rubeus]